MVRLAGAITFDFGQTLAELDYAFLVHRLEERDLRLEETDLRAGAADAWSAYGEAKRSAATGFAAWSSFMRSLLVSAGCPQPALAPTVDWLWSEQPRRNLWRRPIPGMFELAQELGQRGARVGILSNSEGHLAELVEELGKREAFLDITDSGKLGIEKPDPRIFRHAAERLQVEVHQICHIGDSWEADVRGALDAGCRAVYFSPEPPLQPHPDVAWTRDARALRTLLLGP
ncbi:MAG: HAD family hydrolase [Polyangiaceae bacterium]